MPIQLLKRSEASDGENFILKIVSDVIFVSLANSFLLTTKVLLAILGQTEFRLKNK